MIVVTIEKGPPLRPGKERVLFEGDYTGTGATSRNYDILPDGKRFLMTRGVTTVGEQETPLPTRLNVVVNWFEELKQFVPTGKD